MLGMLYFVAFLVLAGIALALSLRRGMLFFPIYFYLYLAVFHALIPLLLIVGADVFFPLIPRQFLLPLLTTEHFLLAMLLVATAAVVFPIGWKAGGTVPLLAARASRRRLQSMPERKIAVATSWAILAIGAIGFFAFFNAFGGIFRALEVARAFRTGAFEISNPLSFMRPIGDFTKVASLLFVALWLAGRRSPAVLAGLSLSIILSFMMLFFQGGRLGLAMHVCLILIMFVSTGYLSVMRAAIIGVVASILLFYGYQLLFFIYGIFSNAELRIPGGLDVLSPTEFFVVELSFPSIGLATAIDAVASGTASLRYGADILYGILSIVPARFLDLGFERAGMVHTAISNPGGGATIPVDMMIYGVYSFNLAGPAIFSFLVGFIVRQTDRYLRRISWKRIGFALKLYFLLLFSRHLVYFDPASSINSIYFLILCTLIVYVVSQRRVLVYKSSTRLMSPD